MVLAVNMWRILWPPMRKRKAFKLRCRNSRHASNIRGNISHHALAFDLLAFAAIGGLRRTCPVALTNDFDGWSGTGDRVLPGSSAECC